MIMVLLVNEMVLPALWQPAMNMQAIVMAAIPEAQNYSNYYGPQDVRNMLPVLPLGFLVVGFVLVINAVVEQKEKEEEERYERENIPAFTG